jgi:ribosomal protein S18 acetylase RimI-like enzyme
MSSAAQHPEREDSSRLARVNEWDSDFFGVRIATVAARELNEDVAAAVLDWARANRIACLYYLAGAGDAASIRHAQDHGFRLVDIRLTMSRRVDSPPLPAIAGERVRHATDADAAPLERIARESHTNTRFHADAGFDPDRSRELYAIWIRDSITGRLADRVLVVDEPDGPAGYVALRLDASGTGHIALIAVSATRRGQGHGERLVVEGIRWLASRGASRVEVITQGAEADSIRFYERCGFSVLRVELWFHRWLDPPS